MILASYFALVAALAKEQAEQQETSEKGWREALEEAALAAEAYAHLAGLYKTYQEQVTDYYEGAMVTIKRSRYNLELKRAETKRAAWSSEIEECRQKKGMTETSSLL
ncbi:MAG: hypothetical protein A3F67_09915 [Verrucomicrobia bacterium RIFCSPHIGHO2_12_FULL_41_10]|nr:MAG: hypothetical protein A3F67_09915 [Verrucomicrobia bacterium RIFCSPHIGHO2_12_FULL_41_10]HLB34225.1 hypothetical protein [Chthoniobacterales bacterium]